MAITPIRAPKSNAGPSPAPAAIVGVKTVKPSSTTNKVNPERRALRGTGVTG